jgi:hypothetical protein
MSGQVAEVDEIARGSDACGGNDVFQFANVAGPGMLQQHGLRAARESGDTFAVGIVNAVELLGKYGFTKTGRAKVAASRHNSGKPVPD